MSLHMAGDWNKVSFKVPPGPNYSMIPSDLPFPCILAILCLYSYFKRPDGPRLWEREDVQE